MNKKRNSNMPSKANNMNNTGKEKFLTMAGIIAIMGTTRLATYRLLGHNGPLARFKKESVLPSLAIFLDTRFNPDMHRELSSL